MARRRNLISQIFDIEGQALLYRVVFVSEMIGGANHTLQALAEILGVSERNNRRDEIGSAMLNELEHSIAIQNEGFENLVRGSSVTMEEVLKRAPANWYIEAQEAKARGLIAEVI